MRKECLHCTLSAACIANRGPMGDLDLWKCENCDRLYVTWGGDWLHAGKTGAMLYVKESPPCVSSAPRRTTMCSHCTFRELKAIGEQREW